MKNKILYIVVFAISIFSSCDGSVHLTEQGVSAVLSMSTNDNLEDIKIRVFNSDDVLVEIYDFSSVIEVSSTLLPLPVGEYTLVSTAGASSCFSISEQIGVTTLDGLLMTIKKLSSSPSQSHYGVAKATSKYQTHTRSVIDKLRMFSQLGVTIVNLPNNIEKVEAIVHNSAKCFIPASKEYTSECFPVNLGKISTKANIAEFTPYLLLPSVAKDASASKNTNDLKTEISFCFYYTDGEKVTMSATMPKIINGGGYSVKIDFAILRTETVVNISDVYEWGNGDIINGGDVEHE